MLLLLLGNVGKIIARKMQMSKTEGQQENSSIQKFYRINVYAHIHTLKKHFAVFFFYFSFLFTQINQQIPITPQTPALGVENAPAQVMSFSSKQACYNKIRPFIKRKKKISDQIKGSLLKGGFMC